MKFSTKALIFSVILSFAFFALPYFLPLPNDYQEIYKQVAPRDGNYLNIDGYNVFVVEKNPAARETVVLIHGFAGNHLNWRSSIEALKNQGYHVIAIDLINFGFSERVSNKPMTHPDQANLIYQILQELEIKQASFVGHSMGGSIITHFYNTHPEMVKRLIYVSPAINIEDKNLKVSEFILRMPGLERWYRIIFRLFATEDSLNKVLESVIINKDTDLKEIKKAYTSFNKFKDWDMGIINANYDFEKNKVNLQLNEETPTCVIWGKEDTVVKRESLDKILEFKQVKFIEMENAGHLPFEDNPDEFNDKLQYCLGNSLE